MNINRILEKQWPQDTFSEPIWSLDRSADGSVVIASWNEELAGRPMPSQEELDALSLKLDAEAAHERLVETALKELAASDWRMTVDKAAAMEPEALEAWKLYRAQLRAVVNGERDVLPYPPVDMYGIESGDGFVYGEDPATK